LGRLAADAARLTPQRQGPDAWQRKQQLLERFWGTLTQDITGWQLDYPRTRLYQDGLPVCGWEDRIVADLVAAGSSNHLLLHQLMTRGAHLMGTEAPDLLTAEYRLLKEFMAAPDANLHRRLAELLAQRDAFIAERIADTLQPGETGLLFLGAGHQIAHRLPHDISINHYEKEI
jgi:hypothetical protein